jgi:hypothetical protein
MSALVKLLRAASITLCVLVAVSMLLFAVNQTSTASGHQQEELNGTKTTHSTHQSSVHRAIDEAAEAVTSPVSGLVSSSSEWGQHAIRLLFALLVYGFGLGYLARLLRMRT